MAIIEDLTGDGLMNRLPKAINFLLSTENSAIFLLLDLTFLF